MLARAARAVAAADRARAPRRSARTMTSPSPWRELTPATSSEHGRDGTDRADPDARVRAAADRAAAVGVHADDPARGIEDARAGAAAEGIQVAVVHVVPDEAG